MRKPRIIFFDIDGTLIDMEKKRIGTRCLIHEGLVAELQELLGEKNVVIK